MPPSCGTRWQRQPKIFPATKKTRRVHSAPSRKLFDPPSPEDHAERGPLFCRIFPPPSPLSLGISPPPGSCSRRKRRERTFLKFHLSCRGGEKQAKMDVEKEAGAAVIYDPRSKLSPQSGQKIKTEKASARIPHIREEGGRGRKKTEGERAGGGNGSGLRGEGEGGKSRENYCSVPLLFRNVLSFPPSFF